MSDVGCAYIVSTSMINALGESTAAVAAAIRANISAVAETQFLSQGLHPIKMANVDADYLPPLEAKLCLADMHECQRRILRLAGAALNPLKQQLPPEYPIPIVCALPEILPNIRSPWQGNPLEQLSLQSGIKFDDTLSLVAEIGRAGGVHAVKHAFKLMNAGHDLVLVAGFDSYWDEEILASFEKDERLLVQDAVDGFTPGEGAAAILLASSRFASQIQGPKLSLHLPGIAQEEGHRYNDQPYRGDGLSKAFKSAIIGSIEPIDSLWTSYIYDSFGAKELGIALTRSAKSLLENLEVYHPADCFGDLGAAVGPTLMALVHQLATNGKLQGQHHLISCSSDLGYRAAVRVLLTKD